MPESVPVPPGHTRVYRAVSAAELADIVETGKMRQGPNSMEGKWFADSPEGAEAHGVALSGGDPYCLIEADVPDAAPSLYKVENLDGRGPARYLDIDDLKDVVPRALE